MKKSSKGWSLTAIQAEMAEGRSAASLIRGGAPVNLVETALGCEIVNVDEILTEVEPRGPGRPVIIDDGTYRAPILVEPAPFEIMFEDMPADVIANERGMMGGPRYIRGASNSSVSPCGNSSAMCAGESR